MGGAEFKYSAQATNSDGSSACRLDTIYVRPKHRQVTAGTGIE